MIKKIFYYILVVLLVNCSTKNIREGNEGEIIVGNYVNEGFVYQFLHLYSDSTFQYEYRLSPIPISITIGKWKMISKNAIELESENILMPINVDESSGELIDSIEFRLVSDLGSIYKDIEYHLYLDDKFILKVNATSFKIPFPNTDFNSFSFKFKYKFEDLPGIDSLIQNVCTENYEQKDVNSNIFTITLPLSKIRICGETIKDTLTIEGDELFWKRKGNSFFEKSSPEIRVAP